MAFNENGYPGDNYSQQQAMANALSNPGNYSQQQAASGPSLASALMSMDNSGLTGGMQQTGNYGNAGNIQSTGYQGNAGNIPDAGNYGNAGNIAQTYNQGNAGNLAQTDGVGVWGGTPDNHTYGSNTPAGPSAASPISGLLGSSQANSPVPGSFGFGLLGNNPINQGNAGNLSPEQDVASPASAADASGYKLAPEYDPGVIGYTRQSAIQRGIDPDVAVRVFKSEGLGGYVGDGGSSFGPAQLHYGGVAKGGNSVGGLGDEFTRKTGLDARDPSTVNQQIDFSLDNAAKGGWGPWHGAQRVGIGRKPQNQDTASR